MNTLIRIITFALLAASASTWAMLASVDELLVEDKTTNSHYVYCASSYENNSEIALKPISELQLGDEVLALAEWQSKGSTASADERLRYERVLDIFTSYKQQTLVHLTLDNGAELTATEGHPFKTTDGWRYAILLKKGGKLLLKGGDAGDERSIGIADVRTEQKTVQVFNLEIANAHTFFVGVDGVLVHNGYGSYTCTFNNGMKYHGKGAEKRMEASIRKLEKEHGITATGRDWTSAKNNRDSFVDEARRIANDRGIGEGDARNYNRINSPGAKY